MAPALTRDGIESPLRRIADKRAVGSGPSCSSATELACLALSSGTDWVAGCYLTVGGQADTPSGPSDHGAALLLAQPEARLCSI